ncbi:MAG: PfkB family carbohydrate kinase [Candidatus Sumerlaeia bacterium]|nr:PfkB family carbohydrate kinase [Candidatus Sumerlaeia bacterium]
MERPPILAVTLHPCRDLWYEVPEWRPDAVLRASAFAETAAGKGLNAARIAAALGERAAALLPADPADRGLAARHAPEVEIDVVDAGAPWRANAHLATPAGRFKVNSAAAPIDPSRLGAVLDAVRRRAAGAVVLCAGGVWPGLGDGAWAEVLAAARGAGALATVLDASGAPLRLAARGAGWLKVNAEELADLGAPAEPRALIDLVNDLALEGAAATLGAEGALLARGGSVWRARPAAVEGEATGAGDAFAGGLCAGIARGLGGAELLRLASAAARARLLAGTGGLPSPAALRDAAEAVRVDRITSPRPES